MQKSKMADQSSAQAEAKSLTDAPVTRSGRAAPILNQRGPEIQKYGERFSVPIGLSDKVCAQSIATLNQVLADTMFLRDLYKKHHWQMSGPTFYQLHLLLDKHYEAQAELMDTIAERIQSLGGISIAMPDDVAKATRIEHPPKGREEVPVQLSRLLEAHEIILKESREGAKQAAEAGDDGTNDLLISEVVRTNELQSWFISEHLVALPMVQATTNKGKDLNA